MSKDILFITAYKDIGRKDWNYYYRTNKEYFTNFRLLIKNINYKLIVYVDNDIRNKLIAECNNNVIFMDINNIDSFLKKYLEIDKHIMNSKTYKNKIPEHRKNNPEHIYSEYNLINHSKINFVSDAQRCFPNYIYYSWIDFGYVKDIESIPKNLDISKFPKKIIYHCLIKPDKYIDANSMLKSNTVFITGSSFIVHNSLVELFEYLWENKLLEWYNNYITDDDQNLILQLYFQNSELFYLKQNNKWFSLYNILD